jgi:hypothetical protein
MDDLKKERCMNVRTLLTVCSLIAMFGIASGSGSISAQDATPIPGVDILPPEAEVDGANLAEWSARSWQWFFSVPQETNPFFDETGALCGYGQSGPVFFLAGAEQSAVRSCVVPVGVHIFVPLIGSECSTVEPPPFFGRDEADLTRCATEAVNHAESVLDMSTMTLSVDGQAVENLSDYRAVTPLYTLWLPEDNLLGSSKQVADSVADSYQVMIAPLPEGGHVVEITIPGQQTGQTVAITYRLMVESGAYAG